MSSRMRPSVLLLIVFGCIAALAAPEGGKAENQYVKPEQVGSSGMVEIHEVFRAARDAVRNAKSQGITEILLRGGDYYLTEPVVFTPEDSGTAARPVVFKNYEGEKPIIHGGRRIAGWVQEGERWVADIPKVREGTWDFSALWVNGERRQPARTPNATNPAGDYPTDADFFYAEGPVFEKDAEGKDVKSATKFHYREGDLQHWPTLEDAVVVVFHSWATSLLRVKSLDTENRIVEFTGPARWPFGRWRPDQWYFVEHLFEALDQPGEWFLNRKEGKLYYIPMPGEDMNTAEVIAPVAKQLIRLEGNPAEGQFVENIRFEGLTFQYTDYPIAPQGHSDSQAAFAVPAAIEAVGARNVTISNCSIGHVGTYGVWFRAGSQDCKLVDSELFDLGAGGVRFGEGQDAPSPNEVAQRNTVDNCFLHDGGRIFRSAIGVWIGRSSYNTVSHNDICDFRYSGVSVGWSWGYAPTSAHHNVIEYNRIHDVGKGQLSDMGGIYTLGRSPGTVLRNNYIHDVLSNPKISGGWGLYTDEGSTGILMENNIIHNTVTGTFHQHYGKENRLENNILAFSQREQLIRSREEDHLSFLMDHNIIVFSNGRLLGSRWGNGNYRLDNNVYWDLSGSEFDFAGRSFEEWKAEGNDVNSVIADPLFEDIVGRDFQLKPGSPAFQFGFKPIAVDAIGLYGAPEWVDKPKQVPRQPFAPPAPPEPLRIAEDFEKVELDARAPLASTHGEAGDARIRVTDESAAGGTRSLKFTDAPGLDHAYNPHLVYAPHFRSGTAVSGCALRIEPGTVFYHEWRDNRNPYRAGPGLWINAGGELSAGGKVLATVPFNQWFRLRIECPLGQHANGAYSLTLTLAGQVPQRFDALPCGDPAFRRLDWFGFVSNATESTALYLDDLTLALE